jgi:ABC-type glycerol-3-phosphate transport system substrate-binding protein
MDNQFPLPGPTPTATPPAAPVQAPQPAPLANPEEAAPPPPGYEPPASTTPPTVRPSPLKIIIPIAIALVVIGLIAFIASKVLGGQSSPTTAATPAPAVTITYFGLWEPSTVMQPVIDAFQKANPTIKVNYQLQSPEDYQDRLKTALESPNPPDVARLHTTWLPLFAKDLLPAPPNTLSATEVSTNFYPIVSQLLVASNQVYGIPLTVEGLALFVNNAMLQQKSLQPPKTWEDLLTASKSLTEIDPATNKITRAGVALGNTTNVDHWPDIVSLMLLQAGVKLSDLKGDAVGTTLSYYTDFVTKYHVWDDTLPPSVVAFANEKVAMIIAPSWRAREIKEINPSLSWQAVPVPQLPDVDPTNWSSIWFEGVAKNSKHPQEAWKFISFLASANAQQILFDAATVDRGYPQPPANKAVAAVASKNSVIAAYLSGMDNARTFYTASNTRDAKTALNFRLIKYLEDAVNSSARSQEMNKVLETLRSGFAQVLSQYGLVPTPALSPTP